MAHHTQIAPAPHHGLSQIKIAKETMKQVGHYIEAGDAVRAAQLLEKAERILVELAREQTLTLGKRPD
jgi:hypothetical protein